MNQAALSLKNVSKEYQTTDKKLTVLSDISIDIEVSSSNAVVGPSGSGKTTFLSLAAGLDRPTAGEIILLGRALNSLSENDLSILRRSTISFIFQSFQLFPSLTAVENVSLAAELAGESDTIERASELLAKVGLSKRSKHLPSELSGGEQQRVAIARAFINQPEVLFADEPTGNLDTATANDVLDLLFSLNDEFGTTLVLATHDMKCAERCGRIIRFESGSLV